MQASRSAWFGLLIGLAPFTATHAGTAVPLNGQSPEVIQADSSACQAQAAQTAPAPTTQPAQQTGGRARGAARGAVAGAAVSEVRNNNEYENYDKIDDDLKQEHRQEQAKDAAVAGAVVGGSRQRRENRQAAQQPVPMPDTSTAFNSCMSGKGYSITP